MTSESIVCPLCGDPAILFTSSNGNMLAIHGTEPTHRPGSPEYPPFVADRQTAINRMVEPFTGHSPGSCPQAWQYDPIEDGEPDWAIE